MYFTGAADLLGALAIAFGERINPQLPVLATIGLMIVMVGAVGSHLVFGDLIGTAVPAAVFFFLLGLHLRNLRESGLPT